MKYLILGGAGFIGSHYLARKLASSSPEDTFRVIDSLSYASNFSRIEHLVGLDNVDFYRADIADFESLETSFGAPDVVVNFAAETHVDNSIEWPLKFSRVNVLGTANLLELARLAGVQKFIQISTDEVYGPISKGQVSEDSALNPTSPYSASKAAADLLCGAYYRTFDLPVVITRCSNNFGDGQHSEKFIPTLLRAIADGVPIPVYGSGSNVREWISVADHCRGIDLAISSGRPGQVYNLGSNERLSNLELVRKFAARIGNEKVRFELVQDRKGHDSRYALDWSKARQELGFRPAESIDAFVAEATRHLLK